MHRTQQSLSFNCAYAWVAVYELSAQCREGKLNRRSAIDKELRAYKFQKLFDLPSFHRPREFWNDRDKRRMCKFNLLCDNVLNCFGKRWKPDVSTRKAYIEYFSMQNWKSLPDLDKNQHTLSVFGLCYGTSRLSNNIPFHTYLWAISITSSIKPISNRQHKSGLPRWIWWKNRSIGFSAY